MRFIRARAGQLLAVLVAGAYALFMWYSLRTFRPPLAATPRGVVLYSSDAAGEPLTQQEQPPQLGREEGAPPLVGAPLLEELPVDALVEQRSAAAPLLVSPAPGGAPSADGAARTPPPPPRLSGAMLKTAYELLELHGPTSGPEDACENLNGAGLVRAWASAAREYCRPRLGAAGSRLTCYQHRIPFHQVDDVMCTMRRVSISFADIADEAKSLARVQQYYDQVITDVFPILTRGAVRALCEPEPALMQRQNFNMWLADWLSDGFEIRSASEGSGAAAAAAVVASAEDAALSAALGGCDVWVDHPVYLLERDGNANFFHSHEDFFNTFIALGVLKLSFSSVQLFVADLLAPGPYVDIWANLFPAHPVLYAWDLAQMYGGARVCFRDQVILPPVGPASPMCTRISEEQPCSHCALHLAVSSFLLESFGLQARLAEAAIRGAALRAPAPGVRRKVALTYLTRAVTPWPEMSFCSARSYFPCERVSETRFAQVRDPGRRVDTEDAMLGAVAASLSSPDFELVINKVNFAGMPLAEQFAIDLGTDILMGPHGAGLQHAMYTPPHAVIIALYVGAWDEARHYYNLARCSDHHYLAEVVSMDGSTNDAVASVVRRALVHLGVVT